VHHACNEISIDLHKKVSKLDSTRRDATLSDSRRFVSLLDRQTGEMP